MSNLFLILVIAFVIIVFAIASLAIGWLIKGKIKIETTCKRNSTNENSQTSHELCTQPQDHSSGNLKDHRIPPSSHS